MMRWLCTVGAALALLAAGCEIDPEPASTTTIPRASSASPADSTRSGTTAAPPATVGPTIAPPTTAGSPSTTPTRVARTDTHLVERLESLAPEEHCLDGHQRRLLGVSDPAARYVVADLEQQRAVEVRLPDAKRVNGGVVFPDGSLLIVTQKGFTFPEPVPATLLFVRPDGEQTLLESLDYVIAISGLYCDTSRLVVDVAIDIDSYANEVLRSYEFDLTDPTSPTVRWEVPRLPSIQTRYSPDGKYVAFNEENVDPAYGSDLSVRDAATGEQVTNLALPSFDPVVIDGDWWVAPIGLWWAADGRLLYASRHRERESRVLVSIDVATGETTEIPWRPLARCSYDSTSVFGWERATVFGGAGGRDGPWTTIAEGPTPRFTC